MPRYSDRNSSSSSQKRPERSTRRQENSPRKHQQTEAIQQTKVFVTNLPGGTKVEEIRQIFEKQGKVIEMFVVDKQKYANAFVHYEQQSVFLNAIKNLNGYQLKNRNIKCEPAKPRVPREKNQFKQYPRNERPRDGGNRPRGCFKCGKEGHLARDCNNPAEGNNYDNRSNRMNEDRRENRQGRRDQRKRDQSNDSRNKTSKKRRDRKRSQSSSQFDHKPQRKRERSDSSQKYKNNKRREILVRKRKRTPSSSKSNERRKDRKHNRSRSAQLRKGKRRNISSSSSSR